MSMYVSMSCFYMFLLFLLNCYCVLWYFVRNDEIKLYNHCSIRGHNFCFKIKCRIICLKLYDHQCVILSGDNAEQIQDWYCQKSIRTSLPFKKFDDENDFQCRVFEFCVGHPIRSHTFNNQALVPFELNDVTCTLMFEVESNCHFL